MSNALLDKLDRKIEDTKAQIAEAEQKATERRNTLAGDGAPEPGTDEFKAATDELSSFFSVVDEGRDQLEALKAQRTTLARREGTPAEKSDDPKPNGQVSPEDAEKFLKAARQQALNFGERLTAGEAFKAAYEANGQFRSSGRIGNINLGKALEKHEFKTLISRASNSAGAFIDAAGPQLLPFLPLQQQPIDVLNLVSTIDVTTDSVKYVIELAATHNVAIVPDPTSAEPIDGTTVTAAIGGLKPESAYTYDTRTADIETLAHFLPVHKNQLSDVPQLRGILDAQMRYGLLKFLQTEVISGDGTSGHLRGIINTTGIVSQAKGTDTSVDAIHKAITSIRIGYNEPTAVVIHPSDWEEIRLAKNTQGDYYYGAPAIGGVMTLWGLPVILSTAVPVGTCLVGDFRLAELYLREGVSLLASDSHADFFRRNLIALLAEMRAGFGVRRPAAFAKVTGI